MVGTDEQGRLDNPNQLRRGLGRIRPHRHIGQIKLAAANGFCGRLLGDLDKLDLDVQVLELEGRNVRQEDEIENEPSCSNPRLHLRFRRNAREVGDERGLGEQAAGLLQD